MPVRILSAINFSFPSGALTVTIKGRSGVPYYFSVDTIKSGRADLSTGIFYYARLHRYPEYHFELNVRHDQANYILSLSTFTHGKNNLFEIAEDLKEGDGFKLRP